MRVAAVRLAAARNTGENFLPHFFDLMIEEPEIIKKLDYADDLLKQGKYKEVIEICEEIHRLCPEEESVLLMLAWAYYDSGAAAQAIEYLDVLFELELQRKIFTGFAFDELVRIYKQEKKYQKLVEICEKAVSAQPEDIGLLVELGNAYLRLGQAKKACNIYEKIVGIEENNPAFYCFLGKALFAAGMTAESENAYMRAGQIDKEQAGQYCFKLAVLFQQAQNHKEAIRIINKCIAGNPDNPHYYCSLGDSFVGLGQMKEAWDAYQRAVQYGGDKSAGAYYNRLGNILLKEKYYPQAAEAFQRAITHDNFQLYYLGLVSAYNAMGLEDDAEKIIRRMKRLKSV
jgi:tetratricopeptide (TPR) repeat protein